ncbi:uncharacterized protein N7500_003245 [Penicillium coprophilum]|uniref:uncharacterized protein n=1 Tax=Penicillium coprophilum TaxID=36646 RepID=UPI0023A004D3|nr:uncharacterized protein N7500_003245 [Penicillium coprophilum]KAJ5170462.1 hypothetical protein N7500_003245 [Penicillium coprophilum]
MIPEDGRRNPDYVIGLLKRENSPLSRAMDIPAGISCTPLDTGDHVLFPFLILEAKSGEYCPDFSAIEKQTAFPIRKLVNLQKSIARRTEERSHYPIVWFLAFKGEDWKIHGCIPTSGEGIRIIQLWNGDIRRADCALQLFLIVDMICDWAADIYLNGVIGWLSAAISAVPDGGDTDSEDWSDAKSQVGELLGEQGTIDIFDDPEHHTETVTTYSSAASPTLFPMPGGLTIDWDMPLIPPPRGQNSVTRNVNEISFSFHHLTLPESIEELAAFLSISGPQSENIAQNAAKLLSLFNQLCPIQVTGNFVSSLEEFWTENPGTRSHPMLNHDELMYTYISFRLHALPDESLIMRDLSCIIASANAISTLHSIAGKKRSILIGSQRHYLQNLDIVTPLKKLASSESFHTASRTTYLSLCVTKDPSDPTRTFSWTSDSPRGKYISGLWQNLEAGTPGAHLSPILGSSKASYKMNSYDNGLLRSASFE